MDQGQTPVNPYAPAGAPYAPGSNTPPPTFATPAVPNTAATPSPDPAYTSISTSSSPVFAPDQPPQKERFFSKKFIIFASVGLALIVAAIVTGVILQNSRNNSSTTSQSSNNTVAISSQTDAITKLTNLLITGKEDQEAANLNTETWYITALFDDYSDDYNILVPYTSKLKQLSQYLGTSSDNELTATLDNNITALADFYLMGYYADEINTAYLNGGDSAAKAKTESLLPGAEVKTGNQPISEYVRGLVKTFLEQTARLLNTYESGNCIANHSLISSCIEQYSAMANSVNVQKYTIRNSVQSVIELIKAETVELYNSISGGGSND